MAMATKKEYKTVNRSVGGDTPAATWVQSAQSGTQTPQSQSEQTGTAETPAATTADPPYLSGFMSAYNALMKSISAPGVPVYSPSREELERDIASIVRPSVDTSIKKRRERGETNMAELDADAESRGMGRSTYVTSLKEREYDDVEDDVAQLEANYAQTLAERVMDALETYYSKALEAQMFNAQQQMSMQKSAMSLASGWYSGWLSGGGTASGGSSGGTAAKWSGSSSSGSGRKSSGIDKDNWLYSEMTASDYDSFIAGLSDDARYKMFNSSANKYEGWRDQIIYNLGDEGYEYFKKKYSSGMTR